MSNIRMLGDGFLLQKQETKTSEFSNPGSETPYSALYVVKHAPAHQHEVEEDDVVALKPDHYEYLEIDGEKYLYAELRQIALITWEGN